MNINEARLYLEHTSKDDFNLEEHQKVNRYKAIQVVLQENERLNNIINELEKILQKGIDEIYEYTEFNKGVNATFIYILEKLQELKENS